MNYRKGLGMGLVLAGVLLTGAPAGAGETRAIACGGSDYACMRDLMFHYRSQATDLKMIAERYAREADFEAKELGLDSTEVQKSREMAKKFWAQAQEADQLARDYQYQLPHNAY
jgi:predicted NBD/HSP70 family sugar kinase